MNINKSLYHKERGSFFFKLHKQLARKYGTAENHLSFKKVTFIRNKILGNGLTRKELVKLIEKEMFKDEKDLKEPIVWYLRLNSFVKNCPEEVWSDILQKTQYDKNL